MNKLLIAFSISFTCLSASACDICGLGTSNYNPVLFTQLSKNYLSINYLHRLYHIQGSDGLNKEYFNTLLVSGQYSITNKLQLVAMVPYQLNKQKNARGINELSGLGDVTLMGNYRLWNDEGASKTQTLTVGAGVEDADSVKAVSKTVSFATTSEKEAFAIELPELVLLF